MLIRAIFVSVLLHLVILLSLTRLDALSRAVSSGQKGRVLNMLIANGDQPEPFSPKVAKSAKVDATRETSVRQYRFAKELKARQSTNALLSPLAGSSANSGKARPIGSPEVTASEPLSVSEAVLGQYRLNVARSARQFKVYPSLAREKGWEGVVHVSVAMLIGLERPVVSLGRSSGYGVLDRQALEMVEQAVNLAILPEGMRGSNMTVSMPVEYRLAD
jgi:protein TonB